MFVGEVDGGDDLTQALPPFLERLGMLLDQEHCSLGVMLTDDEGIKEYNERFRGKREPTDVISFPAEAGHVDESGHYLGDLVVSLERASAQAKEWGHSLLEEMEVLLLHGVLHLLGHDHETDQGEMRGLESDLAKRLFGTLRGLTAREDGGGQEDPA
jgi:probable rRNA maturation factor